jgi:outer membrane protein assembly factor BamB
MSPANLGGTGGIETVEPTPAAANGTVYVSIPGQVMAIRPSGANLTTLWTANFDSAALPTAPAIANGVLYVGLGFNGNFLALDPATGNTLWSGLTAGTFDYSSPAISNGAVFIGGDKRLFAFALNGGNNAAYKRRHVRAPALTSLHPDYRLKPSEAKR